MYLYCAAREWRLCPHTRISVIEGRIGRRKRIPQAGKLTKYVRGLGDVRTAEWTSVVLIGRSYSFGLRRVFAAGPAGCVDWTVVMRGAAALAYLSLEHIKLGFDWVQEHTRKTHQSNFVLTERNNKCTGSPEDSLRF